MKTIKFYIIIFVSVMLFSCKESLSVWSDTTARIQFAGDTLQAKSFVFDNETITIDTILLEVQAIGKPSSKDRPFTIKQVEIKDKVNAVEGVHYMAFSSDAVKKHMIIKAHEAKATVPIIISRTSLIGVSCIAKFELVEANDFLFGEIKNLSRQVIMSNLYEKPTKWDDWLTKWYFGKYSKTKHEFMHKILVEKTSFIPDDEFIEMIRNENSIAFYGELFKESLNEYNATHDEELIDEDGEKVVFP